MPDEVDGPRPRGEDGPTGGVPAGSGPGRGSEPDEGRPTGLDAELAGLVLDESFVRAARVHEPTAAQRARTALEPLGGEPRPRGWAGLEVVAAPSASGGLPPGDPYLAPSGLPAHPWARGSRVDEARWRRFVAWTIAVVMGTGLVALAAAAIYRGVSGAPTERPPGGSVRVVPTRAAATGTAWLPGR